MLNKSKKIMAALIAVTILIPGIADKVLAAEAGPVVRLQGATRVQTAIAVSRQVYSQTNTVILAGANGGEVDALAGTLLAKARNAPLLLTLKDRVDPALKAELTRLKAQTIYILGGELAVNKVVETELKKNFSVKRISGSNREATAVAIAREVNGQKKHIFLAKGYGILADALAIGPASAVNDIPVLLTKGDVLSQTTLNALKEFGVGEVTILGGEKAISKAIENQLYNFKVNRISGPRREDTALAIAHQFFPNATEVVMANGYVFADALVGGYLGAHYKNPILLSNVHEITNETVDYLKKKTSRAFVLGGTLAIGDYVFNQVKQAVEFKNPLLEVTIIGEAKEGSVLKAQVEPADAKVIYQWKRVLTTRPREIKEDIPGATSNRYTVSADDVSYSVLVEVQGIGKYEGIVTDKLFIPEPTFAGGSGTMGDPYQIARADHLDNVRFYTSSHFIQTADIELGVAPWNTGEGWLPIGVTTYRDSWFSGTYNGNSYKINGLTINRPNTDNQGLFNRTSGEAQLFDIGLTNVAVHGSEKVGSLVGINKGTITNCYAKGWARGWVNVGGLVGWNESKMNRSFADVSVIGGYENVGGLAGYHQGQIFDSYALGSVTGKNCVGGLIGYSAGPEIGLAKATITTSYAVGRTVATNNVGKTYVAGIVGYNDGLVRHCYYDKNTTGRSDTGKGSPKTTAEMTTRSTFENWDFAGCWKINTKPGSYPYFQWQGNTNVPMP